MAKLITKYTGLQSASKFESVKSCMINEYGVTPAEAEFYIQNPPAYLFITDKEEAAKIELKKLLLTGAKASIQDVASMTKEELEAASKLIMEFEEYVKPEQETPVFELDLKGKSRFSADLSRISGSINLLQKGRLRVPWEYLIPTLAGVGVMLFMSYLLFPKPPSAIIAGESANLKSNEINFYKYSGRYVDSQVSAEASMTATDKGVKFATISIRTPAAQEQAEEEIILKKAASPWLSQISIGKVEYKYNEKENVFDGLAPAKILLEQGESKLEVNVPLISRVRYSRGRDEVQAAFQLKYKVEDIPEGSSYFISSDNKGYSFFIKFQLKMKLDSVTKNTN